MTKKIRLSAEDGFASYAGNISIPDPDLIQPEILEATNRKWADRARVEVSLDPPVGNERYTGRLWYDTTEGVTVLKMWDGEKWVVIDGPILPVGDGSLGVTLYVNGVTGSDIFVTDDFNSSAVPPITNQMVTAGYNQDKPFKTLARAAIEVARITTDNPGFNPKFYDRIVIMVAPGDQVVENGPATGTVTAWEDGYIPDAEELQKFCHVDGGMILSRGVSVQGEDLRKSIIRPNYVPPFGGDIYTDRSAIFRLTGGSYFFNFTFKDKLDYTDTHHLLDCFSFTNSEELEKFYAKVSTACSLDRVGALANPGETQIVAPKPDAPTEPTDGIIGSSPYVFNCSVRSVLGLCGIHANGSETTGFNSMVVAQFTGVSLQTDIRCWQYYDTKKLGNNPWVDFTREENTYEQLIEANPNDVRQNPLHISSHVRTLNESVIQEVSVFAIGQGVHHWAESGSEITVTNSNSNFGGVASLASGYKSESFPVDSNWEVNRIRPATDMSDQTNNIKEITIGRIKTGVANDATTIVLEAGLQPGIQNPEQPLLLERAGYTLKEGDYIWIVNTRGPDWRAVLTEDPWVSSLSDTITVKAAFENQDGNVPGGLQSGDPITNNPPPIYWPSLANSNIYIRRIVDTRTVGQRQNALLLVNTANSRLPIRDFVVQTKIGGRGIQGSLPDTSISTVASSASITDEAGSDALIELRNNTGDTEWKPGELYRTGTTVRYQDKHFSCVVENSNVTFTPTDWSESYVHMREDFNQEGFFKNAKPIITFDSDKSGLVESQTLGYNFDDSSADDYVWTKDPLVVNQIRTAVDYKGLYNFLTGLGFSSEIAHTILSPRTIADRDINPSDPASVTGTLISDPDGAANDWAKWGIEFRRPSNIRLFGHAFEWAGFGNYTKALPPYQQEISASNIFTYYFTNDAGGRVYASGFNEEGYVVTPRGLIDLATGDELSFEFIGGTTDSNEVELPTFYQELEVAELTVSSSLIFENSTVTGNPTWLYEDAYIPTDRVIGPFGGVLPRLPKTTEEQEGVIRIATQDEANGLLSIDDNIAITPANIPKTSETQEGIIRVATEAEADALQEDNLAITPFNLPVAEAGGSQAGIVIYATQAEANALVRDDRAIAPATIPKTSETQEGIIEVATQAEANELSDDNLAITPFNLPKTSETQQGIIEVATQDEANALSADNLAITPFNLPKTSETQQGIIEVATQAEANALTENNLAITPFNLPKTSETQEGIIRVATQDEANALTENNLAITPGNLPISTTEQIGVVELATKEETTEGTRDDVAVTPFGLSGAGVVPQGGIILWSGSVANIPEDWGLCNGSNGTPDLRDRFVVGAGSTYAPNATGGSANAVLVSHGHELAQIGGTTEGQPNRANIVDLGHSHTYGLSQGSTGTGSGDEGGAVNNFPTQQGFADIDVGGATQYEGIDADGNTSYAPNGVSNVDANLPPYYALAYIMRLV